MAINISTLNNFCRQYRRAFPESGISMNVLIKNEEQLISCAKEASVSSIEELVLLARDVLKELNISEVPSMEESRGSTERKAASTEAGADFWRALAEAARNSGGPIAGALVLKYHKENPNTSIEFAKKDLGVKLGEAFLAAAKKLGV